jgi:tetratricopeptide (TPR) repeat protein
MRVLTALLLILPAAGQIPLDSYDPKIHTAVIQSGHIIFRHGRITARAPEEPVIAERIPKALLDTPAPVPPGATIRQVLANTADGTPGEEALDNRAFFEALKPIAGRVLLPNALKFAMEEHGALGWFSQEYAGEHVLWSYGPSVLLVRVPSKSLTLVVAGGDLHLEDGNIARCDLALAFFRDFAGLEVSERDELIARALAEFYRGKKEASAALVRRALDKFPELQGEPDVTLLHLFAQLGLAETEASATAVIGAHPSLPTAWFYYGQFLENAKRYREAAVCFEKITTHQPPWHNWTVAAAQRELASLKSGQ